MRSISLLAVFVLPLSKAYSDLMDCKKFPNMGLSTYLYGMGMSDSIYSTNKIYVNGNEVEESFSTYKPGSVIEISMSPYQGQLVFQANGGATFQGGKGSRNNNGIISGCKTVSRYQMYTDTVALLVMPSRGTVTIECNFAISYTGNGATKVVRPVILTPIEDVIGTFRPSTIQPSSLRTTTPTMNHSTIKSNNMSIISNIPSSYPNFQLVIDEPPLVPSQSTIKPTKDTGKSDSKNSTENAETYTAPSFFENHTVRFLLGIVLGTIFMVIFSLSILIYVNNTTPRPFGNQEITGDNYEQQSLQFIHDANNNIDIKPDKRVAEAAKLQCNEKISRNQAIYIKGKQPTSIVENVFGRQSTLSFDIDEKLYMI